MIFQFQSTLPREERRTESSYRSDGKYFNPRSHERSDRYVMPIFPSSSTFQSTLPREERRYNLKCLMFESYFNPRSHERSDKRRFTCQTYTCISIHAPTRGATHNRYAWTISCVISIHAPTRGATGLISIDSS